jgi:hypothetical protein
MYGNDLDVGTYSSAFPQSDEEFGRHPWNLNQVCAFHTGLSLKLKSNLSLQLRQIAMLLLMLPSFLAASRIRLSAPQYDLRRQRCQPPLALRWDGLFFFLLEQ